MTIGALSALAGVPVDTIRYYERIGLLPRPARRASGFREYDGEETADRLRFIGRAQAFGFSLRDAGRILALRDGPDGATAEVREIAAERLSGLDVQIQVLLSMRDGLAPLVAACPASGPVRECPILAALGTEPALNGNP